jgi:hypothetical protein
MNYKFASCNDYLKLLVLNIKETSAHWQVNKHTKNSSYFSVLSSFNFLLHTNFIVDYLASMTTFSQSMYPKVQIGATLDNL